jgi:subtilase family serine protease
MKPSQKAERKYEKFHGKQAQEIGEIKFEVPKTFVYLGDAIEIVYKCNKKNGGGDGKMSEYAHKCGKGNILCTDENGKNLYIFGSKQKITERGIVE